MLTGYAQHRIISDILHDAWFANKTAAGVEFSDYPKPISLENLALIFSQYFAARYHNLNFVWQIEFCIGEWSTGEFVQAVFNEDAGHESYNARLKHLKEWNNGTVAVIGKICNKLFKPALSVF